MAVIGGATTLLAQEGATPAKAAQGTLMVQDKNYPLTHALAYETTINDEEVLAVVLSGRAVSSENLTKAREAEKDGHDPGFDRPYLKLEFTKGGELKVWSAGAGNTSLGRRGGKATGELKLQDNRVSGKASQANDSEEMFSSAFDVRFDVALLRAGESLPPASVKKPGPAANVKASVTGVFKGNGKEAKLAYVSAHWREPFNDKPGMVLVFTEKDHSKDKKPDFNAVFGRFGSALIISLHEGGGIFGCQVVHTAHKQQGFTSLGSIKTNNFEFADGKVEGELTTDGQVDTFGETWETNIKFVAPLGEAPAEFQVAKQKTETAAPKAKSSSAKSTPPDADEDDEPQATSSGLKGKDLPLTKDASDFEYKGLVGQVVFKSKSPVKAVAAELTASLKAKGWKNDGSDLVAPASAILKRKQGSASLTVFVKPADGGTEVKMLTEGLDWDE